MNEEILKELGKKIEEISEGFYVCSCSYFLPLVLYITRKTDHFLVCRVRLLEIIGEYLIIPLYRPSRIVKGDFDPVLEEVLKELISDG